MDDETKEHLAGLIAGLQVPRSMGMLGTATEHWDWFCDRLHLFGWHDTDKVREALDQLYPSKDEVA